MRLQEKTLKFVRAISAFVIVTGMPTLLPIPAIGLRPAYASGCGGCTGGGCACVAGGVVTNFKECTSVFGLGCDSCCYAPGESCVLGGYNNHRDSQGGCNED